MNNAAEQVLSILKKHEDNVSGEDMSRALGISRKKVGKHMRRLRELGYELKSVPGKGYSLKTVRGLSDSGSLKLETPDGILRISSGEVHLKKVGVLNAGE